MMLWLQEWCKYVTGTWRCLVQKMAKPKLTKAPELKSLPPTKEAFELHVLKAHIQTAIWKSANDSRPPELEPTKYGWRT